MTMDVVLVEDNRADMRLICEAFSECRVPAALHTVLLPGWPGSPAPQAGESGPTFREAP